VDKRLPLALLISLLILIAWNLLFPQRHPQQPPPSQAPGLAPASAPAELGAAPGAPTQAAQPAPSQPDLGSHVEDSEERHVELRIGTPGQPGSYLARFTNRGAALTELRLGDSFDSPELSPAERANVDRWTHLLDSVQSGPEHTASLTLATNAASKALERTPLELALWQMRTLGPAEAPTGVEFTLAPGTGVLFKKRVSFDGSSHDLRLEIEIVNEALENVAVAKLILTPAEVVPQESGDRFYVEPQAVAAGRDATERAAERKPPQLLSVARQDSPSETQGDFKLPSGPLSFAGVINKYFAVLLRAEDAAAGATLKGALWRRLRDETWASEHPDTATKAWRYVATDVLLDLPMPPKGESRTWSYRVYAGPKAHDTLAGAFADHGALLDHDLGFFHSIANFLLAILNFFERVTGNWGVAIILLTLTVRLALFPINRRSQTAMARFQKKQKRLQPQIDELKKRYAKDAQKLRQAQGELMQKEGLYPPLGGCLPMFVQIPIFFGLFSALRASFDLRQAPFFLWIRDLARPDQLLRLDLDTHLPLVGTIAYLNLLPLLMMALWVLQQRTMPKPADEQAARMQKMMMFMPLVMGLFLYNYAAGLSLYMITQSGMGIVEQSLIKKIWPLDDTERPRKPGFLARLMERQREQAKLLQSHQAARARNKKKK
jgi:YidC/Oxa1 family membrane protein insertase